MQVVVVEPHGLELVVVVELVVVEEVVDQVDQT
jgi:hypothetical protein